MAISYAAIASKVATVASTYGDNVIFVRRSKNAPADPNKRWRSDNTSSPGESLTTVTAIRDDSALELLPDNSMRGTRKYIVAAQNIESAYTDILEDFDVVRDGVQDWKIIGVPLKVEQGGITIAYVFSCEHTGRKGHS